MSHPALAGMWTLGSMMAHPGHGGAGGVPIPIGARTTTPSSKPKTMQRPTRTLVFIPRR